MNAMERMQRRIFRDQQKQERLLKKVRQTTALFRKMRRMRMQRTKSRTVYRRIEHINNLQFSIFM